MHQYLFHIGDFPIRMYGLVLCMSIFLATGVAYFLAKQDGRWQQHILDIGIYGGFAGLIGGRLWDVFFFDWDYYQHHLLEIPFVWQGGMAIQGGVIAGVLAGTPAYCSATYAALPEVTGVDTLADPDSAVDAGKLFLIDDGRQVKLSRAVTSKTTLAEDDPDMLKKIKLVAALDLIRYYAITTVEDEYLGKCANTYDNKCILLVAFSDFFASLEAQNVIQEGSSGAELDADAIRTYLLGIAEEAGDTEEIARIKALTDEALRKEDTGSHVFLYLYGHVLDAMEDFHITLEAQ